MNEETSAVLVVGGSLVGLSAAIFLSWHGVPTILVERHPGSSPHPRAIGYSPRTSELYRGVGLEPELRPGTPFHGGVRRVRVTRLMGERLEELPWKGADIPIPDIEYSPCTHFALSQDRLEPILRRHAARLGADLRYGTELTSFVQESDGVRAVLRHRTTGAESIVRAQYLIGADGNRSMVREQLGIGRSGRGFIRTARSVLFRASLDEYVRDGIGQFVIDGPPAAFLASYGDGRWVLMYEADRESDEDALRRRVQSAIGADVDVELLATGEWELRGSIADRYASGRVLLAGDAAHTLPPNRGGYGANTGIHDAHNLAWKIAAVLSGEAGPGLLDSYDRERRPIAWLCHDQLFARRDGQDPDGEPLEVPILDDVAMHLGYRYPTMTAPDTGLPPARRPDEWAGRPGTRAPHMWLSDGDNRVSTLDLFGRNWVLLATSDRWLPAAKRATQTLRVGLQHRQIAPHKSAEFNAANGLQATGATLVRPDGFIAWRSPTLPTDPGETLMDALSALLFRDASRNASRDASRDASRACVSSRDSNEPPISP